MNFLRCIFCGESSVKIFGIFPNGNAKSKCMNCGTTSSHDVRKDKIKIPEVIYSR